VLLRPSGKAMSSLIGLLMARLANSKMAVIAAKSGQTCVPVRALTAQICGCAPERMGLAEFLDTP